MRVKHISKSGKNTEKHYKQSKRHGRECRNHGSCPECRGDRTYFDMKNRAAADMELKEYIGN